MQIQGDQLAIHCDAIRPEQFENGQFSWAYNIYTWSLDIKTSSAQKINFARHEYERVEVEELRWDH